MLTIVLYFDFFVCFLFYFLGHIVVIISYEYIKNFLILFYFGLVLNLHNISLYGCIILYK